MPICPTRNTKVYRGRGAASPQIGSGHCVRGPDRQAHRLHAAWAATGHRRFRPYACQLQGAPEGQFRRRPRPPVNPWANKARARLCRRNRQRHASRGLALPACLLGDVRIICAWC